MSRFLLLLVFLGWMSWSSRLPSPAKDGDGPALAGVAAHDLVKPAWFVSGYVLLVLATGVWGRRAARRVDSSNLHSSIKTFNRSMAFARMAVPAWFIVGLYFLGWGALVAEGIAMTGLHPARYDTPALVLGCLPAFLAWMGLWWSQYPADVSIREQGLLSQLEDGMPIHRPPSLGVYFRVNLRLQLLFTIAPVLALVLLRDVVSLCLRPLALDEGNSLAIQGGMSLATAAVVFLFAPELLKRVLHTEPLADGPLRRRLEAICRRNHVRYKDVLLWRTEHNMGNAAVMGLIPQVRYILMSDLLLATMTDEQIEAVFAHEVGHIVHRHMLWFAVFFATVLLAMIGLAGPLGSFVDRWFPRATWPAAAGALGAGAAFMTLFLYLSRKFERQADVFAARSIQADLCASGAGDRPVMREFAAADAGVVSVATAGALAGVMLQAPMPFVPPRLSSTQKMAAAMSATGGGAPVAARLASSHVGHYGATLFSAALHQVARINSIPITAPSWCHGSIATRISCLQDLSADPARTAMFDRIMARLYIALMMALCGFGAWAMVVLVGR